MDNFLEQLYVKSFEKSKQSTPWREGSTDINENIISGLNLPKYDRSAVSVSKKSFKSISEKGVFLICILSKISSNSQLPRSLKALLRGQTKKQVPLKQNLRYMA